MPENDQKICMDHGPYEGDYCPLCPAVEGSAVLEFPEELTAERVTELFAEGQKLVENFNKPKPPPEPKYGYCAPSFFTRTTTSTRGVIGMQSSSLVQKECRGPDCDWWLKPAAACTVTYIQSKLDRELREAQRLAAYRMHKIEQEAIAEGAKREAFNDCPQCDHHHDIPTPFCTICHYQSPLEFVDPT